MSFRPLLAAVALLGLLAHPARTQDSDAKLTVVASVEPTSVKSGDNVTLRLKVSVEHGYHVYGSMEKLSPPISFQLTEGGVLVADGPSLIPPGVPKVADGMTTFELKGTFELSGTYRVRGGTPSGATKISGTIGFSVCDENMCLPPDTLPFETELTVLPGGLAAEPAPTANAATGTDAPAEQGPGAPAFGLDQDVITGGVGERIRVEARIEPAKARPGATVQYIAKVTVEDGFHAYGSDEKQYGEPVGLTVTPSHGITLVGEPVIPPGTAHETGGLTIYELKGTFELRQSIRIPDDAKPGEWKVEADVPASVCDDSGCLPLQTLRVTAPVTIDPQAPVTAEPAVAPIGAGGPKLDLFALILASILGGLFALSMPCTYPMIPITISFFTKQADARNGKVLPLALAYGAGIVVIFVIVGVLVGPPIVAFGQHWLTNLVIAVLFVVFALSLFGAILLQPPQWLMSQADNARKQGGLLGVFLMGATLVITSFTCSAPIVGTLLVSGGAYGIGEIALAMAVFGLTMATPFVALALLPGSTKSLPKSGEWMHTLKVWLGFVELAAALKFVSNADLVLQWHILPYELFLFLWFAIFAIAGLFLLGFIKLEGEDATHIGPWRMSGGVATLLFAVYCLYGALGYKLDDHVMTPLAPPYRGERAVLVSYSSEAGVSNGSGNHTEPSAVTHDMVVDDYEQAKAKALASQRLLLVNFTGHT